MSEIAWKAIFEYFSVYSHNFNAEPFYLTAKQLNEATKQFVRPGDREARIICKQDHRKDRPQLFVERDLFLLPVKNGIYAIVQGEGYIDIPDIEDEIETYKSKLEFSLETSVVGNSEMQHVDYAYATSLIRTFFNDDTLVLTIRGRKYTPSSSFSFRVGNHRLTVASVQTEVDAGYEGKNQVVLVEAKNSSTKDTIIRQLFYPYRQWQSYTKKQVKPIFFEKQNNTYSLWQFEFSDPDDYNSIHLVRSSRFVIV
jgi:hypothetical protein